MPLYDNEIVSVITPVYNVEKVIGKTLESMIAQEYDDLEIVLVDDCSKDNSADVIAKYRPSIRGLSIRSRKERWCCSSAKYSFEIGQKEGMWLS